MRVFLHVFHNTFLPLTYCKFRNYELFINVHCWSSVLLIDALLVCFSGCRYEGYWKEDKKHGLGCLTTKNGLKLQCYFIDDKIESNVEGSLKYNIMTGKFNRTYLSRSAKSGCFPTSVLSASKVKV